MNLIYQLIPDEIIRAVGWTIFHSIWQGSIVALILGTVFLFSSSRSANFRYKLAVSALLLILFSAITTFTEVYSPGNSAKNPAVTTLYEVNLNDKPSTTEFTETPAGSLISLAEVFFASNIRIIFTIWLLGLLVFSLRFVGGLIYVDRLKTKGTSELQDYWLLRFSELKTKLKIEKAVCIYQSARVKIPIAIGYLKPVILLPVGMITGLPPKQVEAIIIHELAHVKRYDFVVNGIQILVETLFFYHPAIWWISSAIRAERENCCDDLTLEICGDKIEYSKALFNLQSINSGYPDFALGAIGNENNLYRRIKRMNEKNKTRLSYGIKFAAFSLILIALLVAAIYSPKSYASKNAAWAEFVNPVSALGINLINPADDSAAIPDTSGLKKGKRTLRFSEEKDGQKVRYKAKLYNGKLENLYIDGEKVPSADLQKYEPLVDKKLNEYDSVLAEYKAKRNEYKKKLKEYSKSLREYREKLSEFRNHRHNFDFDFDFDFPAFDFQGAEVEIPDLDEILDDVREELDHNYAEHSLTIPPIPPIHIPPIRIPPIHIDKEEMEAWQEEFKESMKDFKLDMEKFSEGMEKYEEIEKHKWDMKKLGEGMKGLGEEMKKFGEFIKEMKYELVRDGIIYDEDEIDELLISEDEMEVNGKSVSPELHRKYLDMYEKQTGKKLEGSNKIRIVN